MKPLLLIPLLLAGCASFNSAPTAPSQLSYEEFLTKTSNSVHGTGFLSKLSDAKNCGTATTEHEYKFVNHCLSMALERMKKIDTRYSIPLASKDNNHDPHVSIDLQKSQKAYGYYVADNNSALSVSISPGIAGPKVWIHSYGNVDSDIRESVRTVSTKQCHQPKENKAGNWKPLTCKTSNGRQESTFNFVDSI